MHSIATGCFERVSFEGPSLGHLAFLEVRPLLRQFLSHPLQPRLLFLQLLSTSVREATVGEGVSER